MPRSYDFYERESSECNCSKCVTKREKETYKCNKYKCNNCRKYNNCNHYQYECDTSSSSDSNSSGCDNYQTYDCYKIRKHDNKYTRHSNNDCKSTKKENNNCISKYSNENTTNNTNGIQDRIIININSLGPIERITPTICK